MSSSKTDLHNPGWLRAADLHERAQLGSSSLASSTSDAELARFRLERWQAQAPFTDDSWLERRLCLDGLTRADFLTLLGEAPETLARQPLSAIAWLEELAEAFEERGEAPADPAWPDVSADFRKDFLRVAQPLIERGRNRLLLGARRIAASASRSAYHPDQVELLFLPLLLRQLLPMLSPVMVLEMHIMGVQGNLTGSSPRERFDSFVQRLRQPEVALAILAEYPVLARQIVMRIDQWLDCALGFLHHLTHDLNAVEEMFALDQRLGPLSSLEGGIGDRHDGGHSVLIASFQSGLRIVYKPRSLAVDRHFQDLLCWVNDKAHHEWFRPLRIVDRGTHGWVEYVETADCADLKEVTAFYERQGAYLALLNALQATDCHYENLIAAGEFPVLIDLETLFHPRARGRQESMTERVASRAMSASVLRLGLLPRRMFMHQKSDGVDVSGLGAQQGQLSPQGVPLWEDVGTDAMKMVRGRSEMPGGRHRPTLEGTAVDLVAFLPAILRGFESIYNLIIACKAELLSSRGPLAWFEHDSIRAVLRPTRTYALLLRESFHPDLLRDALDRDRHFDRLWIDVPYLPDLERILPLERAALAQGDVPLFTSKPSSCDLFVGSGETLPDFFETSGLELARERLRALGPEDYARQVWFIRASVATLASEQKTASPPPTVPSHQSADRERLLEAARQIADKIHTLAIRDGKEVGWAGLKRRSERFFGIVPLTTDLYDGLPGIALFLGYLGRLTGEPTYTNLARITLTALRGQLGRSGGNISLVGGFEGWGGVIYLLTHLAALWGEPELLGEAEGLLPRLPELVSRDEALDVIDGSAGCIGALLGLHRMRPSGRALDIAIQCGDRLLARAQEQPHGLAWPIHLASTAPLTGFAHGAAGIAWALAELAAATGEERFLSAARKAIDYERSLFSQEAGNWPDLRIRDGHEQAGHRFVTAWCFGAAGIGLARLACLPHLDDSEALEAESRTAAQTTLTHGFGFNHSLCHGDLGNIELLVRAGRQLGDPKIEAEGRRMAASILDDLSERGPRCATPAFMESPGLMTGLAGIGYGLLRLAAPEEIPSVLLLEFPRGEILI